MSRAMLFIGMALLIMPEVLTAQDTVWTRTYGGTERDQLYHVEPTADGGFIAVGSAESWGAGLTDIWLVKFNADGDTIWTRTFGDTGRDMGYCVQQTSDSGYIIAGYLNATGPPSPFGGDTVSGYLVKTDTLGNLEWDNEYVQDGAGGGGIVVRYIHQLPTGGYMVCGYTWDNAELRVEAFLARLDDTGAVDTVVDWLGALGYCCQPTPDGGYVVTGFWQDFGTGRDVFLAKTDSNLVKEWAKTYGSLDNAEGCSHVELTPSGGFILAGFKGYQLQTTQDVYLLLTDASGDTTWTRTYGDTLNDESGWAEPTVDGGYIAAARRSGMEFSGGDGWLLKTDAAGDTLWSYDLGSPHSDAFVSAREVSGGEYIAVGFSEQNLDSNLSDGWIVKIASGGCCNTDGIRGDADNDCTFGCVTVSDLSFLVSYLFQEGPAPVCEEEANADSDCTFGCVTVADVSFLVAYLFQEGPQPGPCP